MECLDSFVWKDSNIDLHHKFCGVASRFDISTQSCRKEWESGMFQADAPLRHEGLQ